MVFPHWWAILAAAKAAHWAWKQLSEPSAVLPPNVIRSPQGIRPAPGFEWVSDAPDDRRVRWVPGKVWAERHIVAGPQPGDWRPLNGYAWLAPEDRESLDVRWVPGREYADTHLMSGAAEGEWHPCPGYRWRSPGIPGCYDVVWSPGIAHSRAPHVLAAEQVGRWRPEPGWRWISTEKDDLRVEPVSGSRSQAGEGVSPQRLKDLGFLGLDEGATQKAIEEAFRRLARIHHPDRYFGQAEEAIEAARKSFLLLRAAYERLQGGGA